MYNLSKEALGLRSFNHALVEQLKIFLNIKEARLANVIMAQVFAKAALQNIPLPSHEIKLLPLVQHLKNHLTLDGSLEKEQEKVSGINQAFWHYVQILEENIAELFQRIDRLEISDWTFELFTVVTDIKDLLLDQLSILIDGLTILEEAFQKISPPKLFHFFRRQVFDKSLLKNLSNSKSFLITNYESFKRKYGLFDEFSGKIVRKAKKFKNYIGFASLEKPIKKHFLNIYRITNLWDENLKVKVFNRLDFLKEMKQNIPLFRSYLVLKQYLESINSAFFRLCEEWRLRREMEQMEDVQYLNKELSALGSTIEKYRNLLLSTDPNPYVRSRLGFKEWVVGPEPRTTKEMLELIYNLEALKRLIYKFENSAKQQTQENDPEAKRLILKNGMQSIIHELGQPLVSKSMVRSRLDKLIEIIDECDELAGSTGEVGNLVTEALLNAFRIDWHYQLLFENPKFQEILTIHKNSEKMEKDFFHHRRIQHFRQMASEIENWVRQNASFRHMHDLETHVSDAKEQMQVYLSHVKRRVESLDGVEKSLYEEQVKLQLLEYYEVFDRFFFLLKNYEVNGKMILNQFQFIDLYLQAIKQLLH